MLRPTVRSPRVRTITFLSSICRIYSTILEQHWASSCVVDSPELCEPSIRFVFLRPRVCHRASFRFSAIGRMSFWLTPRGGHPCRRLMVGAVYLHSGLSPPSYCPCRAHNKKVGFIIRPFDPCSLLKFSLERARDAEHEPSGFATISSPDKRDTEGSAACSNPNTKIVLEI